MRIVSIVLLTLFLIISCESPAESQNETSLYRGTTVELGKAPFLLNSSLAKKTEKMVVISENSSEGTVFGLQSDDLVYAAEGGEVLPQGTWVGNQHDDPVEVYIGSSLTITFDEVTTVTLIDAKQVMYLDENGETQIFNGSGVISTQTIFTTKPWSNGLGKGTSNNASTTLISPVAFGIGGEGGENG